MNEDERLPVAWTDYNGKKWLIRGTPTGLLWVVIRRAHHGCKVDGRLLTALVREMRTRQPTGYQLAICDALNPPPCACGGPGLYINNGVTYCRRCQPKAVAERKRWTASTIDKRLGEREASWKERERQMKAADRARAHPRHHRKAVP